MSFLYPLGFLGLIAVPVLIIIYIIKNKYTEQVVSATYLWTLSEKFLKRKNPINRLTGIISLILQIVAVVLISLAIAHPVLTLRGSADDYCFILDGSGSMNITQADKTRLDIGKDEIRSVIQSSANGSSYTLVYAGADTEVVYEGLEDKDRAIELLGEVSPLYSAAGFTDAISVTQKYFDENPSLKIYLVTDKSFESCENVTLINVAGEEENYALSDVEYKLSGGKLVVSGNAVSYSSDASLDLSLIIDDGEEELNLTLDVKKLEVTPFSFTSDVTDFKSLKVVIENADALAIDNESVIYNVRYDETFTTLVVTDDLTESFFIRAVLAALGNTKIEVVSTEKFDGSGGYGLYIFDSYSPKNLPEDGAVWFFNPVSTVADTGFNVLDEINLTGAGKLVYNTSSSTKVKSLLNNVNKNNDIYITQYVRCGQYRNFTTMLSYDGTPVVFAGSNAHGNREVVFAMDLHKSDFALTADYVILANNLVNYTFPSVLDGSSYYCGDVIDVNVLANCDSIRVDSPSGKITDLDTDDSVAEYQLTEAGIYTVTVLAGGDTRQLNLFSALPESERFTAVTEQSFVISGEPGTLRRDGIYDDLIAVFIVLAVIYLADWMVYCYEQYQLR